MSGIRLLQLEEIAKARVGVTPRRDAPFGRHMLRIPTQDWEAIKRLYPDLINTDPTIANKEWERFERSAFAEPYRVSRLVKGVFKK